MGSSKPHDAFRIAKTPKQLQNFARNLEVALERAIKNNGPYNKVSVLAFHWANDEMQVVTLESQLLEIFTEVYGYETESFTIPVAQSTQCLGDKLLEWSKLRRGQGTLRIYVYSGHASHAGTVDHQWFLGGRANARGDLVGPRVDWFVVKHLIEYSEGDACYIFDCCSAGSAALYDGPEVLCASGWGQTAGSNLPFSFTQALIDTLKDLAGETKTLAEIFAIMYRNAYQSQMSASPLHIARRGNPSIALAPLTSRKGESVEPRMTRSQARDHVDHRVLISVHLQEDTPDLQSWSRWLATNLPPVVFGVDVKIESVFRAGSTLVLVTLPLEIWTMLDPRDEAFTFVAHVLSNNILPVLEGRGMPIRPPPGPTSSENMPPGQHYRKSLG
ncbi:hypothetical protein P168DRAFT_327349 [Aspergillus campestris IBT 28561]|uniref:Caspase domain-containing protein n=1 Tax=Aspergillus campestris (strain IBT 28561) TaxID=1392248 RepID=A0A2I1D3F6_ASPC2|nr:uncharacterized protein P168DRAFT_327349 [Aspergillus campestris IBT 28561]PKY04395.1 hypothetical protein P168DRAFT_327349 [Aspergillus campestris IBT 28561]